MRVIDNLLFPLQDPEPSSPSLHELPDQHARANALDTRASWIVEAPAGSGKTGLLMQRYLKLLADNHTSVPEEVLAITFTRKATAELRTRVLEQLEAAHGNFPLPDRAGAFDQATRKFAEAVLTRDAGLGWGLLDNPSRLRIRTIDSLCTEIAGTLPLLSGSGGGRRPVDDASALYRIAARRTLMQLGGSDPELHRALHTVLLHRDGNLADCEALLARMLETREQWAELVPLDRGSLHDEALEREVRPRLERALEGIVCAGLTRALHIIPRSLLQELTTFAQELGGEPGYMGGESPIAFCESLHGPPEDRAEHLDHWLALIHLLLTKDGTWRKSVTARIVGFEFPKAEKPRLDALIAALSAEDIRKALFAIRSLPSARYPEDQWVVAKALFRLLLHALAELKILFAERGECDFAELSLAAREALQSENGPTDLAASAGSSLRHLLVDEMQDTSSAQYQLLDLLTRSWDGHSQTLFLVGDPKQSIYLFRQARVERFLLTVKHGRLGDVPLSPLRLTSNFRSQPQLVASFNQDFERLFPSPAQMTHAASDSGDVPFVTATPVRSPNGGLTTTWHAAVLAKRTSPTQADPKRERALAETREIRCIIEEWQARPLPPGRAEPWRIAVLARVRRHLAPIVAEFQRNEAGCQPIPFRAVDVEALGERQEVLDVLALTRALLHPADRVAWLAVLRAPWCGLGIADLLALTGEGAIVSAETARSVTIASLILTRSKLLSADGQSLLTRAWPILEAAQAEAGRSEPATLVERTWYSLGGDVMLKPEEITNVRRYLKLLHKTEETGGRIDLTALDAQLRKLYAEPAALDHAVEMMTIHKAKGLEWDLVVVPSLEKRGQVSRPELLNWLELEGSGEDASSVLLAPIQRKGEQGTELYRWISSMTQARERAERKRLLYVACTRAREALHLFGSCEVSASGTVRPPSGTLLESYWPAAEEHFVDLPLTQVSALASQLALSVKQEGETGTETESTVHRATPLLYRLSREYDPTQRFRDAAEHRLAYPAAATLEHETAFERPEGSFAVRAFGNVIHRFLQLLAERMATGSTAEDILRELPTWQPRLIATLRGEGLSPNISTREAARALASLTSALKDPVGRWILSPQTDAASESSLSLLAREEVATMRVDRTFSAGLEPLSTDGGVLWIVDFKTTEQGSRSPEHFAEEEKAKYGPQLTRYAALLRATYGDETQVVLGLYYPGAPKLIHWQA